MIKPLGIIIKNGAVVNHRSLLKVLFNPLLRVFGFYIASNFEKNDFLHYKFYKGPIHLNLFKNIYLSWFTCNEYDEVIIKRRII